MKKKQYVFFVSLASAFIILFMLYGNFHTPYLWDDWVYLWDFSNGIPTANARRIDSVWQIFKSMAIHRNVWNGRVIAHFFVQLFMMFPKSVFNIINSVVFLFEIFLIYLCGTSVKKLGEDNYLIKTFLFFAIFAGVFIFQPMFGQVNFYLAGAINYLWAAVISLIYICLFLKIFKESKISTNWIKNAGIVFFGFIAGAYCENVGLSLIFFSSALIAVKIFLKKQHISVVEWLSFAATVFGFIFMIAAPAELYVKITKDHSLYKLTCNIIELLDAMKEFKMLWVVAVSLLAIAVVLKADKDSIIVSVILILCAVVSFLCLSIGFYIAPRTLGITVVFLIVSITILIVALIDDYKPVLLALCTIPLVFLPYYLSIGFRDLGVTYTQFEKNIEYIYECRDKGIMDVPIYYVLTETKYCALTGIGYIDENPENLPNCYMAKYYGVDSISIR